MMKKKRNFDARFWSGSRKHSAIELFETFFQFNDPTIVKEALSTMMQYSVRKKARITDHPAEVFHLYLSLRSLVKAGHVIGKKSGKGMACILSREHALPLLTGSLSEEEFRDPVSVFRKAFKACSRQEYECFLSTMVYFSLGNSGCDQEKGIIRPYLHLVKMLEAAWLIRERTSAKN